MITFNDIKNNKEIMAYIQKGNANLGVLGYTDHSEIHSSIVAEHAVMLLEALNYPEHDLEVARIAGFMHDIGNAINRSHHAEYGGLLANDLLSDLDISIEDRVTIASAIANHDESTGSAVDPISAALIIADKTDVRRNRVRNTDMSTFDIHDRVNYAVTGTNLKIDTEKMTITLALEIDNNICTMYDYFEIFLGRMLLCRKAAGVLGCTFKLLVNGSKVL